jgi:hypothetical protein
VRLGKDLLAVLALTGVTRAAAAQTAPPPAQQLNRYSSYEHDIIDDALEYLHAAEDRHPEGKVVEGIDVITLEVFEKRDLVPGVTTIFNVFHTTTKPYVVEREILVSRGEPFRQALVDDSIRNLRNLVQLSVVLTLATKGSAPDRVRLVVITKDVWSLRPNWNIALVNGGLLSLYAKPAEINLAGTHQTVNGTFLLQPNSLLLGGGYANPRLFGTHMSSQAEADIILNLPTGQPEGSQGYLIVGQPLYSPLVDWAWDAQAVWQDQVVRRYEFPGLGCYPTQASAAQCAQVEATGKAVPFAYRQASFLSTYTVTRSWGWTTKHDVSFGLQINRQGYPATPVDLEEAFPPGRYDPMVATQFIAANVPVSDNRVGPFLQYHTYAKSYARLLDFDTLGLQEDFRLGHNVFANVYPVVKALGSTRDFVGFDVAAQYTVKMGDGLARAAVESITEVETSTAAGTSSDTGLFTPAGQCPSQPGRPAVAGPVCDASIEPAIHVVSPTLLFGRLVFDAHLLYRFKNYLNQNEFLGGDTRMRGYPANYFTGYDILDGNLEYRTRSVDILTAQIGLVAFYDVGEAWNGWGSLPGTLCRATSSTTAQTFCPVQGAGAGLRILFPQLDRIVFRTDLGFPLGAGRDLPGVTPIAFFFSLGQAFYTPAVAPGAGTGSTIVLPQISGSPTTALAAPP